MSAHVIGLYVGAVESFTAPDGKPLSTGIRKAKTFQCQLATDGFADDANALPEHRTLDKAVHIFSDEYYAPLQSEIDVELPRPTFGENLLTTGLLDADVRVGDHLKIGDALVCVTQPAERCKTIGRSSGYPKILKAMHRLGVCGIYAKVIKPGLVRSSGEISWAHRETHDWAISKLHHLMFHQTQNDALFEEIMALEKLSPEWKARLQLMRTRAAKGEALSSNLVDI